MRILFFGDSIGQGFYDREGGWVQRLSRGYHQRCLTAMLEGRDGDDFECFNLGVSGDTITNLLERFEAETKARRWEDDPLIIVVAIGINDARQRNNRAFMDVYDFQDGLEKLLAKADDLADGILCVGLSAVNESQTDPWPYFTKDQQWSNARINAFEDTVKQTAGMENASFVPVHDQFLAQLEGGADLLADGLHPNEAGHQLIAELVKPALDELIAKTNRSS